MIPEQGGPIRPRDIGYRVRVTPDGGSTTAYRFRVTASQTPRLAVALGAFCAIAPITSAMNHMSGREPTRTPLGRLTAGLAAEIAANAAIVSNTGCGGAPVVLTAPAPYNADAPVRVGDRLLLPRRGRQYVVKAVSADGGVLVDWRATRTDEGEAVGGTAGYDPDEWAALRRDADAVVTPALDGGP